MLLSHLSVVCLLSQCISGTLVQYTSWGPHTLKGWWNPGSSGPRPKTILQGYDYIVVGSGPGGGPLASRLALAGHRVLVLEAGNDTAATDINATVPILNAKASEDPRLSWSFYVDHYPDLTRNARDYKYIYNETNGTLYHGLSPPSDATPLGFLYPRTAALGGCVNHNALIMMYPLPEDWDAIANLTGDNSWNATGMRGYFERLERCEYLPRGTPGHGFDGWLATNRAEPSIFLSDNKVYWMLKAAADLTGDIINSVAELVTLLLRDLNTGSVEYPSEHGLYNAPLNMDQYIRSSPRDFLLQTAASVNANKQSPGKLDIRLNSLVTRIIFAPGTTRAVGVEFLDGASLYRADPRAATANTRGVPGVAFARKEIVIAGGTYNTPQLLQLSGVGDATQLAKYGIPQIINLPGVGKNLQDRIENSVIANASEPWTVWKGCTLGANASDPCLIDWYAQKNNASKYSTNGRPAHIPMRSSVAPDAFNDLVITGRPGYFAGYFPGYSTIGGKFPNSWTWPVLKAHTQNRAGVVELRSSDPQDVPYINFNYFDAGSGDWQYDVDATVEGMQFARKIFASFAALTNTTTTELIPGSAYSTADQLAEWVKYNSWGHHACCTAQIGADGDNMAVLDSAFRVRGARGLRVVDASIFPTIPGFYIQTSIYIVSEKAADVIAADANKISSFAVPRS